MNIVADTNIFLAVALNEPEKDRIIQLTAETTAIAPEILPYEVGNALSAMVKRHKLSATQAQEALEAVNRIPVRLVATDIKIALKIALEHNIYAYDAYFLQCAWAYSSPLLTLDRRMQQAALEFGIDVLESSP